MTLDPKFRNSIFKVALQIVHQLYRISTIEHRLMLTTKASSLPPSERNADIYVSEMMSLLDLFCTRTFTSIVCA